MSNFIDKAVKEDDRYDSIVGDDFHGWLHDIKKM